MTPDRNLNVRILIVTPEVTYLPDRLGSMSRCLSAKAGGLADVSATLVCELYRQGADVHVAIPNYKAIFGDCLSETLQREHRSMRRVLPDERLHLAEDHSFGDRETVYTGDSEENIRLSLAFQREVINNIIPRVVPDLIHCNDWMTGLIPARARQMNTPCLFSIHNIHTMDVLLSQIEDRGIDPRPFWRHLYFNRMPIGYDESRSANAVDLLVSGVFSASAVSVVSPAFLSEIIIGGHEVISTALRRELTRKWDAGMSAGILNAPDATFSPASDPHLVKPYEPQSSRGAKTANKIEFQRTLGLTEAPNAPLLFWPSRLDPLQKGCQLLAEILYPVISAYWEDRLQVAFVADGPFQQVFKDIARAHGFERRIAVHDYDPALEHLGYGAADFVLMPSRFEPCGLPQMIGAIYGALPIAHAVGGLKDTVRHLNPTRHSGNGFLFKSYDAGGLYWAIEQAMAFYHLPVEVRFREISRIMDQSAESFNHQVMAGHYIDLYQKLLGRPVVAQNTQRN